MNIKTTGILFGLLCAAVLTFFLFQYYKVRTPDERKAMSRQVLPTLYQMVQAQDNNLGDPNIRIQSDAQYKLFDRITIERAAQPGKPAERIVFHRQGSQWRIVSPREVRTDTKEVHKLIDQMALAEHDGSGLKGSLAEYGLDKPSHVIRLHRGNETFTLSIGKPGAMVKDRGTEQERPAFYYVVSSELPNEPMILNATGMTHLLAPLANFRDRNIFSSAFSIRELELGGTKRESVSFVGIAPEGVSTPRMAAPTMRWEFRQPRLGDADSGTLSTLIRDLSSLRIEKEDDFLVDGVTSAEELTKFGLSAEKPDYAVTLKNVRPGEQQPVAETLLIGKPITFIPEEHRPAWHAATLNGGVSSAFSGSPYSGMVAVALTAHPEALHNGYYARMSDSSSIFRIDGRILPNLSKPVDELRSRALTRLDLGKLDAIDLTMGQEVLQFRRQVMKPDGSTPSDWDLYRPGKGKVKTDTRAMAEFIDALNQVDVRDTQHFLDDAARQKRYQERYLGTEPLQLGLEKPLATITLWQTGIERDAQGKPTGTEPTFKKEAKPTVKLTISPKDERFGLVYIKREMSDQAPAILAVKDRWFSMPSEEPHHPGTQPPTVSYSLSDLAVGGYLHYRDHTVPAIAMDQAERMTVDRAGVKYVLEHTLKKEQGNVVEDTWKLKEPVAGNSPNAPTFLHFLTQINAQNLVTDKATPEQWDEHGVRARPWMLITVQSFADDKKNREEFTLFIGKQTDAKHKHPGHYYARAEFKPRDGQPPESNDFLFLISPEVVKSLDLELRDGTIFPLERGQTLEQASLTWHILDKEQKPHLYKLVLVQTADMSGAKKWTVHSYTNNGTDITAEMPQVDAAQVARLYQDASNPAAAGISLLNPLLTERFLIHNSKPAPEQRLDPQSKDQPPVLSIEVKLSNGTIRTLALGSEFQAKGEEYPFLAGRTYRVATASTVPNAVFLVHPKPFEELLKGPDFFKSARSVK